MKKYHTAVIGAGPAGYKSALKIAESGKPVCLISRSREETGGTCLNRGCIPVKSFLESANLYKKIKMSWRFGLAVSPKKPDFASIREKTGQNINFLKKGLLSLLNSKKIDLRFGSASFLSREKIKICSEGGKEEIKADNFVLAAGSKPRKIPSLAADNKKVFNSNGLCEKLPAAGSILIVGGGYIGCEFAHFYNCLGAKVTIVEISPSLLPGRDKDTVKVLAKEFSREGIQILTSSKVVSSLPEGAGLKVEIENTGTRARETREFDLAVVSAGRIPDTEGLNLENAGIETEGGFIKTGSDFQTTAGSIYAIGDLINTPMLAHVAYCEAEAVAGFITGGKKAFVDYSLVPGVVFSQPQVAFFGLSQQQAEARGIEVDIGKRYFKANAKALISGYNKGFVKLVLDKKSRKLAGASIVGPCATELIHTLLAFAKKGALLSDIDELIYAHPTLSETFSPL